MLSLRSFPDERQDEAAARLVRAVVATPSDENGERVKIVEEGIAAGVWHVGPAALPIPLLSL